MIDDPAIAISFLDEAVARAKTEAARDLPLAGAPFMVKDNIDVAGLPTTAACPSFAYMPERSATAVARLEAAGAVVTAKTNLDQFATGLVGTRSPYGTPVNPRDPSLIPGGSSSGSAVAVARGIVPFALGTDTAGSGRVPASLCGVVGLKPTRGWISTTGVVPAVRSLDCVSVFATTVEQAWSVANIAAGFDPEDPFSRRGEPTVATPPYRIGYEEDVDLKPFFAAGELLYGGPWVAERYAAVGEFLASAADADEIVRSIILGGAKWSAVDAALAHEELARLRRQSEATWDVFDAIVLPTVPWYPTLAEVAADPVGVNNELGRFTNFVNLFDLCAVALPDNRCVIAPAWSDGTAVAIAAQLVGEEWSPEPSAGAIELAVVGAHLRGEPLHHQLAGAGFVEATTTAPAYRLYALAGQMPPKPGMVRDDDGGAIEVEVYAMDAAAFGRFTAAIPPPLCIGSVELADGRTVKGFLCEDYGLDGATEITRHGGWRSYLSAG